MTSGSAAPAKGIKVRENFLFGPIAGRQLLGKMGRQNADQIPP